MILAALLLAPCLAYPGEVKGVVVGVDDAETFDLMVTDNGSLNLSPVERVKLADVEVPTMLGPEGQRAESFVAAVLLNRTVWLDLDNSSSQGRDDLGRLTAVVYLTDSQGQQVPSPNFNRMMVDSGFAEVDEFVDNEFDLDEWWGEAPEQPAGDVAASSDEGQDKWTDGQEGDQPGELPDGQSKDAAGKSTLDGEKNGSAGDQASGEQGSGDQSSQDSPEGDESSPQELESEEYPGQQGIFDCSSLKTSRETMYGLPVGSEPFKSWP
ncbi:MAG: hypothetical protein GKC10_03295 [Methanosarcinales archaeon]|nr:hypothetical protein [Methanosarcinales archaeon]